MYGEIGSTPCFNDESNIQRFYNFLDEISAEFIITNCMSMPS